MIVKTGTRRRVVHRRRRGVRDRVCRRSRREDRQPQPRRNVYVHSGGERRRLRGGARRARGRGGRQRLRRGNPDDVPRGARPAARSNGLGGKGLSVGATDAAGERAAFSSTGTYVSLAAPGERVFSAVSSTSPATLFPRVALPGSLGGLYGYGSGTSFAAPQVAGAAALVMAANPRLDAEAVAAILKETASGRGDWSPELGYGVIDVAAAVERAATGRAPAARSSLALGARISRAAAHPDRDALVDRPRDLALGAASRRRRSAQRSWKRVSTARTNSTGKAAHGPSSHSSAASSFGRAGQEPAIWRRRRAVPSP